MSNYINITGQLCVEVDCPSCGMTEEVIVDVNQNYLLDTFGAQLDIDDDIYGKLSEIGWVETDAGWVCPDCQMDDTDVDELDEDLDFVYGR